MTDPDNSYWSSNSDLATPHRAEVLQQALDATMKSRNSTYGAPYPNLLLAAELKQAYNAAANGKYSPAHDDAIHAVLSKIARIATGATGHTDNYVDGAAYMAIAAECQVIGANNAALVLENRVAAASQMMEQEAAAVAALKDIGLIVDDPINRDTALPATPEPERVVEPHAPQPRPAIIPVIDSDSPAQAFSDAKHTFRLGSLVSFGPNTYPGPDGAIEEPLWTIIRIQNNEFGEFVSQHQRNGQQYHGLARHIHKVVRY